MVEVLDSISVKKNKIRFSVDGEWKIVYLIELFSSLNSIYQFLVLTEVFSIDVRPSTKVKMNFLTKFHSMTGFDLFDFTDAATSSSLVIDG